MTEVCVNTGGLLSQHGWLDVFEEVNGLGHSQIVKVSVPVHGANCKEDCFFKSLRFPIIWSHFFK